MKPQWYEILNSEHAKEKFDLALFSSYANFLGYPYFYWENIIYGTPTGKKTGWVKEDIE